MNKTARRIHGPTIEGKPIVESIASVYCRVSLKPLSAVQAAQREDGVDTPMNLDGIANTLIEEPPGDMHNPLWNESPCELMRAAIRIMLDSNSQMTSDALLIIARKRLNDDA